MKAEPVMDERLILAPGRFAELAIWRVAEPVRGSTHRLKYRLAFVVDGVCVLRYDNETGKGDHRHVEGAQTRYAFISHDRLLADFWSDVENWRP